MRRNADAIRMCEAMRKLHGETSKQYLAAKAVVDESQRLCARRDIRTVVLNYDSRDGKYKAGQSMRYCDECGLPMEE